MTGRLPVPVPSKALSPTSAVLALSVDVLNTDAKTHFNLVNGLFEPQLHSQPHQSESKGLVSVGVLRHSGCSRSDPLRSCRALIFDDEGVRAVSNVRV